MARANHHEAWLRLLLAFRLGEDSDSPIPALSDVSILLSMTSVLNFLRNTPPGTDLAQRLHSWLTSPVWAAAQLGLPQALGAAFPADPVLVPSAAGYSPHDVLSLVRNLRNRARHRALAVAVAEDLLVPLVLDHVLVQRAFQHAFHLEVSVAGAGRVMARWDDGATDHKALRLDPLVVQREGTWYFAAGSSHDCLTYAAFGAGEAPTTPEKR